MNKTKIDWADYTWNPTSGCTKVSEGCRNCYAEGIAKRFWGERKFTDVRFHPERLNYPETIKNPSRIFVDSMSDLFHDDVRDTFLDAVFMTLANYARRHTYIVLTKRPERMKTYFQQKIESGFTWREGITGVPIPNLILGVSVENQESAYERIPMLLRTPAYYRVLSVEPMIGSIDLAGFDSNLIDWVIVGGESGTSARRMKEEWAVKIQWYCAQHDIPFFFKQWGEFNAIGERVGKKAAGHLLHGMEWHEYPKCLKGDNNA